MPDLLLELYSDEIPARMQADACGNLCKMFAAAFERRKVDPASVRGYVTPNRLCAVVEGLPDISDAEILERRGPRQSAPETAIAGFARSAGIDVADLELRTGKSGTYYYSVVNKAGMPISDIVASAIPEIVKEFPWPKSMRWGSGKLTWVRPLKSVLCILYGPAGAIIVDFEVGGLRSGNTTPGHRFMAPTPVAVSSFEDYQRHLEQSFVVLDAEKRLERVSSQIRQLADQAGLLVVDDPELLKEIAGLTEWPTAVLGEISPRYRSLPPEVLVTTIRTHLRFVALKDRATAQISHFAAVTNKAEGPCSKIILAGYLRVLNARLDDAGFAWDNDLRRFRSKDGLAQLQASLDRITFHSELGSLGQRVARIGRLGAAIAETIGADRRLARDAAAFMKLDLLSGTVGEFPELQGIIGRRLAGALELDRQIGLACEEHYLPGGPDQRVPVEPLTVSLALAEKLDLLAGFFGIGQAPTGSRDPFALRRAALGVVRILSENRIRLKIGRYLAMAAEDLGQQGVSGFNAAGDSGRRAEQEALDFVHERLVNYLESNGARHDCLAACIAAPDADDLYFVELKARSLQDFLDGAGNETLVQGYRRASNILKSLPPDDPDLAGSCDPELFVTGQERLLFGAQERVRRELERLLADGDAEQALHAMAELIAPINSFFENVRVVVEDRKLQCNRVRLLAAVQQTIAVYADLSRVET